MWRGDVPSHGQTKDSPVPANYRYSTFQKIILLPLIFKSETIIRGMLSVTTKNSERLTL
jgi:hypothetical protein